jgi:hypothetical protein
MRGRGQTQAAVAKAKAEHPELYCPHRRCLWRTDGGYCPRHQPPELWADEDARSEEKP